jgi:hypothetical protein
MWRRNCVFQSGATPLKPAGVREYIYKQTIKKTCTDSHPLKKITCCLLAMKITLWEKIFIDTSGRFDIK